MPLLTSGTCTSSEPGKAPIRDDPSPRHASVQCACLVPSNEKLSGPNSVATVTSHQMYLSSTRTLLVLQFDNFHGGSDERFMPTKDQYVFFDDIKVTEGLCLTPSATNSTGEGVGVPGTVANATLLAQQALTTVNTTSGSEPRRVELAGPGEDACLSLAGVSTMCGADGQPVPVPVPEPAPTFSSQPDAPSMLVAAPSSARARNLEVGLVFACGLLAILM